MAFGILFAQATHPLSNYLGSIWDVGMSCYHVSLGFADVLAYDQDAAMRFVAIVLSFGIAVCLADTPAGAAANGALLPKYCAGCHSNRLKTAGVTLQGLDASLVADKGELLERVLRKVKTGQMPPAGLPRPDAA